MTLLAAVNVKDLEIYISSAFKFCFTLYVFCLYFQHTEHFAM